MTDIKDTKQREVTYLGRICRTMVWPLIKPGTPMTVTIRCPGYPDIVFESVAYPGKIRPKHRLP